MKTTGRETIFYGIIFQLMQSQLKLLESDSINHESLNK